MPRGPETEKSHEWRLANGFYTRYMKGDGVDVGYRGHNGKCIPVLPLATGIDIGSPGYDGIELPFAAESKDYVFSSHCYEHLKMPGKHLKDWYRVLKYGGYIVLIVPHQYLYEKKLSKPSRWNSDHRYFFTPAKLLYNIEDNLPANHYRIREFYDNDRDYDYSRGPESHPNGCYEIVCVLQKIKPPTWIIE